MANPNTNDQSEASFRTFLLKLSDALRPLADAEQIHAIATQITRQQFNVDRCYYCEIEQGNAVIRRDATAEGVTSVVGSYPLLPIFKTVLDGGVPFAVENSQTTKVLDEGLRQTCLQLGITGFINVPVIKEGEPVGILAITQSTPRQWTSLEVELSVETAERTWAAVERAKAEAALRREGQRKDEFMAMLGHELRNPLAVVANTLLYLDLSKGEDPSLSYPIGIQRMSRQVEHLGRMVDDLLEVSRIRQGKIRLQRQPIELGQVVQQAVEAIRSLGLEGDRSLNLTLPPTPVFVNGDTTRLAQVVTNLLTNAAKYTDEGGHIWVTLAQQPGQAILQVTDDGMGIPADYLRAIFDVFVQGETSLDRPHGGLGLGLAVVKQIVEGHDGQIEAYSDGPGKGSEFVMKLPLVAQEADGQKVEPINQPTERNGIRVLLVDDNRELIDLMGKIMQMQGYEVHLRYSGQEGIIAAEALAPDVLLLDVGMPQLDGYAVCRHIRQQAWGQHLPIIALTGFGQEADRQRSWAAGFDEHLLKPIDYTSLADILAKTIAAKRTS